MMCLSFENVSDKGDVDNDDNNNNNKNNRITLRKQLHEFKEL